jgi:hypothetical protein
MQSYDTGMMFFHLLFLLLPHLTLSFMLRGFSSFASVNSLDICGGKIPTKLDNLKIEAITSTQPSKEQLFLKVEAPIKAHKELLNNLLLRPKENT